MPVISIRRNTPRKAGARDALAQMTAFSLALMTLASLLENTVIPISPGHRDFDRRDTPIVETLLASGICIFGAFVSYSNIYSGDTITATICSLVGVNISIAFQVPGDAPKLWTLSLLNASWLGYIGLARGVWWCSENSARS